MEDASTKETIPRCEAAAPAEKPSSWLLAKEIPYAMTVIVTALGWCVVHVIGAIEESPSVGYGKKIKPINKDSFEVTFRVTNITRSHFFRRVSFYVSAEDGSWTNEKAIPQPPAKIVEDDNFPPQPEIENKDGKTRVKMVRFYVAQFQPGTSWDFYAILSNVSKPEPQILADFSSPKNDPRAKVEPASIRLIPNGAETFLVRYQVAILLFAGIAWLIIAIVYVWSLRLGVR